MFSGLMSRSPGQSLSLKAAAKLLLFSDICKFFLTFYTNLPFLFVYVKKFLYLCVIFRA